MWRGAIKMKESFEIAMGVLWEGDGEGMIITDWETLVDFWAMNFHITDVELIQEIKEW